LDEQLEVRASFLLMLNIAATKVRRLLGPQKMRQTKWPPHHSCGKFRQEIVSMTCEHCGKPKLWQINKQMPKKL
jgi:hypothetical protein